MSCNDLSTILSASKRFIPIIGPRHLVAKSPLGSLLILDYSKNKEDAEDLTRPMAKELANSKSY